MELIYNWIAEIIVFLLIATMIDLLLPSNQYKKYIKLVIGLVLLLIFLKPLFYLFNINVEQKIDEIVSSIDQGQNSKSINNMYQEEIQLGQDAYIYEYMEEELKSIAEYSLIDEFQVEIAAIEFIFKENLMRYEALVELIVYITEFKGEGRIVKPVKDVRINNHGENNNESELEEGIIHLLKEIWEIEDEEITIVWVGS